MKDRRQNLYCGPEHKLIPTLSALANYVKLIGDEAKDANPYNWADKVKRVVTLANGACAEVDKLIMIDNKEVEDAHKTNIG